VFSCLQNNGVIQRSFPAQMFLGFWNVWPTSQIRSDGQTFPAPLLQEFVLVSQGWGCRSKAPILGGLQQLQYILSKCRRLEFWNQGVRRAMLLLKPVGESFASSQLRAVCGQSLVVLGLPLVTPVSASVITCCSSYVCLSSDGQLLRTLGVLD